MVQSTPQSVRARPASRFALAAVVVIATAPSMIIAQTIEVPTDMPLDIALATATSGTTINILPSVTPYQSAPGFNFSGKQLTIQGASGNPADVILDGAALAITLSISGAAADGSVVRDLTIRNGRGSAADNSNGAGVLISSADVTIDHCVISGNILPSSNGAGAGLYATTCTLTVRDTDFLNNQILVDSGNGGGSFITNSTALFENCRFIGNSADPVLTSSGSGGGGVWVQNGAAQFTHCLFENNQAEFGGGVFVRDSGNVTLDACTVTQNTARFGASVTIFDVGQSLTVRNSLITGNTATVNEVMLLNAPSSILNCTITGNSAATAFIIGSNATNRQVAKLDNCIVRGNATPGAFAEGSGTNMPVLRYCLVDAPYAPANGSTNNQVLDAAFVDAPGGNYHLQAASPAIDAGDSTRYAGPLADFDGLTRGIDVPAVPDSGNAITGPVVDIGAFEYQVAQPVACPADFDGNQVVQPADVAAFVSTWFNAVVNGCP